MLALALSLDGLRDIVVLGSAEDPSIGGFESVMMGPPKERIVLRWPEDGLSEDVGDPMRGEFRFQWPTHGFLVEHQHLVDGAWSTRRTHRRTSIAACIDGWRTPAGRGWAHRWVGALSYDLSAWSMPIPRRQVPSPGSVIGLLWRSERWARLNQEGGLEIEGDRAWVELVRDAEAEHRSISQRWMPSSDICSHDRRTHASKVRRILDRIRSGDIYQMNLAREWHGSMEHPPDVAATTLFEQNPAAFSTFMLAPDLGWAIASASPEQLLHVEGGRARTSPIKGTAPRGEDADLDRKLMQELLLDEKERAEHRMLVDLERNDLGRICEPASVHRTEFRLQALSEVQHLVSDIEGRIRSDASPGEVLDALFPGGSITGCPKLTATAIIDAVEAAPRGFWTGSAGWIEPHTGDQHWSILIRTLEARLEEGHWLGRVLAGGGIVIDSDPEREALETEWKAASLRRAAGWRDASTEMQRRPLAVHRLLAGAPTRSGEVGRIDTVPVENGVVLVDNLDSFTWNIANLLASTGRNVWIASGRGPLAHRIEDVLATNPTHIVLGPGPGEPSDAPLTMALAHRAVEGALEARVLGICLGHQALGVAAGFGLERSRRPMHGSTASVVHDGTGAFEGAPESMDVVRYNSLTLKGEGDLAVSCRSSEEPMGLRSEDGRILSYQFHPESIGNPDLHELITSFISTQADA